MKKKAFKRPQKTFYPFFARMYQIHVTWFRLVFDTETSGQLVVELAAHEARIQLTHFFSKFRRLIWRNIEAVQVKRQLVDVRDVLSVVAREKLEMRDRVTKLALGFEHLVIATTKQCYIFR